MLKARQYTLHAAPCQKEILRDCQMEAARCWNEILDLARQYYEETRGKWIGKNDLQKALKGRFRLHSQTVQALTDKFAANRQTAATLRRQGNKAIRYPHRRKKYCTIPFKQTAIRYSPKGTLVLTLVKGQQFDTGFVPDVPVRTAEILWRKGRYVLSCTGEFPESEPKDSGLRAGVDIGEIHPLAVCAENGACLVVSGREIRAIKQFRNKSLGKFQKRLLRCKKGSRRKQRLARAKRRLMTKTDAQVRDMVHQATRKAINFCLHKGVNELVIGDPQGVEKDTRQQKRLSRKCAQKVAQMEYGRIKDYLAYKAKEAGIITCLVNERGTSQECPVCGAKNRARGRVYRCSCGFVGHRDGKAGFLILRKNCPDISTPEFAMHHVQCVPKYRKRVAPACVVGPGVALSSSVIAGSLDGARCTA